MSVIKNASWQISLCFPSWHSGFAYGKGLQSFGSSCFWAFHCFAMDSKELSSILDCFGDQKAIKTPKLNTIWLKLIARVLNMPIELKGNNYYSKVFKRVNYKLSNSTFWVVISSFTVCGGLNVSMSRIDYFFLTSDCEDHFSNTMQTFLPRPVLDHSPILLEGGGVRRSKTPFKFKKMWLKVVGFKDLVKGWWEGH